MVNITTINCHLLAWCGCWRPAAHWLCATVAHRPAAQHQMVPGSPVRCVVLCGGNQENIAKITWEYDVLSELGKCVSCVVCSVKCRNSCHPRCGIESIWRWHQAMWLWHIYYVLFYSLEQFYFSSPCHVSTFSLFSSQIGCFNLYFVHFLEQRCIRLPSASDAISPYGEYSPHIIDD